MVQSFTSLVADLQQEINKSQLEYQYICNDIWSGLLLDPLIQRDGSHTQSDTIKC